ncbi:MAG: hypothetical protein ACI4D9_05625 [Lachnospiraceae bacterium]
MEQTETVSIFHTLHFLIEGNVGWDQAKKLAEEEAKKYREYMERSGVKYKILSERTLEDGTIVLEIKEQYDLL